MTMQLGLPSLPAAPPEPSALIEPSSQPTTSAPVADPEAIDAPEHPAPAEEEEETPSQTAIDLHRILLETTIREGKLVCGNCGHEYAVKEGVPNFLVPGHLV
jgi:multifunctional methyltransferase subunit TRM112